MAVTGNVSQLLDRINNLEHNLDDFFLLSMGIMVSLMQAGFACLEAGCVNSKNVTNIIMKNVLDTLLCAVGYWLIGYSLAYSPGNGFAGYHLWAGYEVPDHRMSFWFFQFIFATTAATIISGAVAERCNFVAYIVYSFLLSGVVYPIVSHWVWADDGWLVNMGFIDFAGSGAVHLLAGVCSLVAAVLLGPRIGRFENGKVVEKPGHSKALMGVGGLILISGFMAFNCGSLLKISKPKYGELAARTVINTVMGGGGAALVVLFACRLGFMGPSTWAFSTTLNACISGMASIAAGADTFTTVGALLSGICACCAYMGIRTFLLRIQVDDPLESVAVHLGGGLVGVISVCLFSRLGFMYSETQEVSKRLLNNLIGAAAIITWSAVMSILVFGALKLTGYLRVSEEDELEGLDITEHNEPAYPAKGWHQSPHLVAKHDMNSVHLNPRIESPKTGYDNSISIELQNKNHKF